MANSTIIKNPDMGESQSGSSSTPNSTSTAHAPQIKGSGAPKMGEFQPPSKPPEDPQHSYQTAGSGGVGKIGPARWLAASRIIKEHIG